MLPTNVPPPKIHCSRIQVNGQPDEIKREAAKPANLALPQIPSCHPRRACYGLRPFYED
jgi:hypothetical protein